MRYFPLAFLIVLISTCAFASPQAFKITRSLAPGVSYTQELIASPPTAINVLLIDPIIPGIRIQTELGNDSMTAGTGDITKGREGVRALAQRKHAIAAVNADYFNFTGDPLGFGVMNGEMYSEPWTKPRAAFGINSVDHSTVFDVLSSVMTLTSPSGARATVTAINRPLAKSDPNDLVCYTQLYGPVSGSRAGCTEVVLSGVNLPIAPDKLLSGTVAAVNGVVLTPSVIPDDGIVFSAVPNGTAAQFLQSLNSGDKINFEVNVSSPANLLAQQKLIDGASDGPVYTNEENAWSRINQAVGGGPLLLVNGELALDGAAEGFDDGFVGGPHPRTAVGATKDGKIVIAAVEGQPFIGAGVSLVDMAGIMKRYGAWNAINLDGGGSTTMAVEGVTVNYPNFGTGERLVADMLAVYSDYVAPPITETVTMDGPAKPIAVLSSAQLSIVVGGKTVAKNDKRIVWSGPATNGVGYITQDGLFTALRPGVGDVTASVDGQMLTGQIQVVGPPVDPGTYEMTAKLSPVAGFTNQSTVSVRLSATTGLPGAGIPVTIKVYGGSADQMNPTSDEDGLAKSTITWDGATGAVVVSAGTLIPVTLPYTQPAVTKPDEPGGSK